MIGFLPNFQEEKRLWRKGFKLVIGVDEVGRGSWVGPVVVAAVTFCGGRFSRLPHVAKDARRPPKQILEIYSSSLSERRPPKTTSDLEEISGSAFNSFASGQPPRAFTKFVETLGINDSKALSSQKREQLAEIIKDCSLWSVAEVGVGIINKVGIGKATQVAMRKAVDGLWQMEYGKWNKSNYTLSAIRHKPFVLVDAFNIKYLKGIGIKNQKAIIKGDQKSISIAAASILAKVYRDNLMWRLAKKYPRYGWGRSKGYGTNEHQKAILKYGMTRLHRKQFVKTFLAR